MLADAHELVLSGWSTGAEAADANGRPIGPASAFARAWSAPGALTRAWTRSQLPWEGALDAFQLAHVTLAAVVGGPPQRWNDEAGRTERQVLDALAEASLQLRDEPAALDVAAASAREPRPAVRSPSRSRG